MLLGLIHTQSVDILGDAWIQTLNADTTWSLSGAGLGSLRTGSGISGSGALPGLLLAPDIFNIALSCPGGSGCQRLS